jgi:ComF family protein
MQELLGIFYPRLCCGCNATLAKNEKFICTRCLLHLPLTNFHREKDNALEKLFWGRVPFERAYSFMYFKKGGTVQRLLHELKYKGNKDLGEFLGSMMGETIIEAKEKIDAVVAVPLHRLKLRKRGYNQSDFIAKGLSGRLNVPDISASVKRRKFTETQTRKSRFERWENVADVFVLDEEKALENRHVLLVDDVITTGATIEACAQSLLKVAGCRVSVASIAMAAK